MGNRLSGRARADQTSTDTREACSCRSGGPNQAKPTDLVRTIGVVTLGAILLALLPAPAFGAEGAPISMSQPVRVGEGSIAVAIDATGRTAYSVTEITSQLHRIDVASAQVTHSVPVTLAMGGSDFLGGPRSLIIDDARGLVLVGTQSRAALMSYGAPDLALIKESRLDTGGVTALDQSSDGSVFVGTSGVSLATKALSNHILRVNPETFDVDYVSPLLASGVISLEVDVGAGAAFFIGNDASLRKVDLASGVVQLVFPTLNEVVSDIDVDEANGILYVAMSSGVRIVDTSTMRVIKSWPSVPKATAIALASARGIAFVVAGNRLTVVHIDSGEVLARDDDVSIIAGYGDYLATNGRDPVTGFVDGSSWIRLASMTSIPPSPPRKVRVKLTGRALAVSWEPPRSAGDPRVIRYRAKVVGSALSCTSRSGKCTIAGVEPGRRYRVQVVALARDSSSLAATGVVAGRAMTPRPQAPEGADGGASRKPSQAPT